MRFLLTASGKRELFGLLKKKYKCRSIHQLSLKMNISFKTLQGWFYNKKRYIPSEIVNNEFNKKLEIVDKKDDNWGQIKGGIASYNKLGDINFKRMQSIGGKRSAEIKDIQARKKFKIDISDPFFLEFYGNLLGDGWLSNFKSGNKKVWIIGMCGNLSKDRELLENYKNIVKKLFNRENKFREIPKNNVIEFIFNSKLLLKFMNEKLDFPIGKKENLYIHNSVKLLGFDKVKYVLKGIFDTDGTFYLQRNRKKIPKFPVISIHMNELRLIKQIGDLLEKEGFRVNYSDHGKMIRIQGKEQLKKWLGSIGSSNPKHLRKMNCFLN